MFVDNKVLDSKVMEVLVIGATIMEHMGRVEQEWIKMIEKVIMSRDEVPKDFQSFAKVSDELGITNVSRKGLKTIWWEKYQVGVKEISTFLQGK